MAAKGAQIIGRETACQRTTLSVGGSRWASRGVSVRVFRAGGGASRRQREMLVSGDFVMAGLPTQIGRYEIKSLIGRGGMGDLYLAHDPNTNRLVTIKLLNGTLDSSEVRERFAREARALAALNHPNIVNIYDSGEYEG